MATAAARAGQVDQQRDQGDVGGKEQQIETSRGAAGSAKASRRRPAVRHRPAPRRRWNWQGAGRGGSAGLRITPAPGQQRQRAVATERSPALGTGDAGSSRCAARRQSGWRSRRAEYMQRSARRCSERQLPSATGRRELQVVARMLELGPDAGDVGLGQARPLRQIEGQGPGQIAQRPAQGVGKDAEAAAVGEVG